MRLRAGVALALAPAAPALAQEAPAPPTPPAVFATVARADGTAITISARQLQRFQQAVVAVSWQTPGLPIDPPEYRRCRAFLRERGAAADRRWARCSNIDRESRGQAAKQVLSLTWVVAELDRQRIVISERALDRARADLVQTFAGSRRYRRFLRDSGLRQPDVDLNLRSQLGQTRLVRRINAAIDTTGLSEIERTERQQIAIDEFVDQFATRWLQATTCLPPYASLTMCVRGMLGDATVAPTGATSPPTSFGLPPRASRFADEPSG